MGRITWLASYPKSGNTWLRIFLTNYLRKNEEPADINDLDPATIASSRVLFEEFTGIESSELTNAEIERYRPAVYRQLAAMDDANRFMKVHDAYCKQPDGSVLFPTDITERAVYLVRNPFDVAVSFAEHSGSILDKTICHMGASGYAFEIYNGMAGQLRQVLGTWSGHVDGWQAAERDFPILFVRYEDMCRTPQQTFGKIVHFITGAIDEGQLQKAICFSSFEILQQQEATSGFQEHPQKSERFFRQGSIGSWRNRLSGEQVQQIIANHNKTMRRWGYLNVDGDITV